jgi:hypothetical protein
MGSPTENPMGVEIFGMVAGLGFVLSFGYWCTNFLVVQRAMAADSMSAARRTPLIGTLPKMFLPFIVILPGIAALVLSKMNLGYAFPLKATAVPDYDQVLTTLMAQFYPAGMLGVGLTGLMASFMSGMAGNVTAFNTVFTYDIYQSYIRPGAPDRHYLTVGRVTTVVGVLLSIGAAYLATRYNNIMDLLQLVFGCRERAAVRHLPAGHVLEAHHRARRFRRIVHRHRRRDSDAFDHRRRRAMAAGSPTSIRSRRRWRRTSGSPSSRLPQISSSPLWSACSLRRAPTRIWKAWSTASPRFRTTPPPSGINAPRR